MDYYPCLLPAHLELKTNQRVKRAMQYAWLIVVNYNTRESYSILKCIHFLIVEYLKIYPNTELGNLALTAFKVAYAMLDQSDIEYVNLTKIRNLIKVHIPGLRIYGQRSLLKVELRMLSSIPINQCLSYLTLEEMSVDQIVQTLLNMYTEYTGQTISEPFQIGLRERIENLF